MADELMNPDGMTNEQLLAMFVDLQRQMLAIHQQQAASLKVQTDRTAPKENPNYVPNSIFIDPESGKEYRELLKCPIFFGPIQLNRTPITRDECDALNRLEPVDRASVTKVDGSTVRISVVATRNEVTDAVEKLTIKLPLRKEDNPQHYPSLRVFALQLAAAAHKAHAEALAVPA